MTYVQERGDKETRREIEEKRIVQLEVAMAYTTLSGVLPVSSIVARQDAALGQAFLTLSYLYPANCHRGL